MPTVLKINPTNNVIQPGTLCWCQTQNVPAVWSRAYFQAWASDGRAVVLFDTGVSYPFPQDAVYFNTNPPGGPLPAVMTNDPPQTGQQFVVDRPPPDGS